MMLDLHYAPYQRKKNARKAKATPSTSTRPRSEGLRWTPDEDSLLRDGVCKFGGKKWKTIAELLERRTADECNKRWNKLQSLDSVVKRPWAQEEDAQMFQLVKKYGASKWAVIASYLTGRNGKQCRERWHNQLNPSIKKTPWTDEENAIILSMQAQFGNCWAKITSQLPGRTDNAVKNHWHSSLKTQANRACGEDGGQAVKRLKTKRKMCKAKLTRAVMTRSDSCLSCHEDLACSNEATELGAESDGAVDGVDAMESSIFSTDSSAVDPLDGVVDFFLSPILCTDDSGSLSPDVVSSVDHLDLYTYAPSYQEDVMRAQAVIDTILDPMGMERSTDSSLGPLSLPEVCASQATIDNSKQDGLDAWCVHTDEDRCDDRPVESVSTTQSSFGLDELLYDSLGGPDALQETTGEHSSGLVLSAPLGEVSRVYKQSALVSDWGLGDSKSCPVALGLALPTHVNGSPIKHIDEMPFQSTEEVPYDGVSQDLLSQESGYAQHFSALSSLLDVEF